MTRGSVAYVTSFDPRSYRRPLFVKKALPHASIYYLKDVMRLNSLINKAYRVNYRLAKIELKIYPRVRSGGDALVTALTTDLLNKILFLKLRADAVLALNPFLGSRRIWGKDRVVIVDWMDVFMWPRDEINPFDVETIEEADGVIFWSRPLMEIMSRRIRIKSYTYIPHGLDLSDFDPTKVDARAFRSRSKLDRDFLLVYSGGAWLYRGVDLQGLGKLVRAAALASRRLPDLKLVLQLGRLDTNIVHLCKRLGVLHRTRIIGPLPYNSPERLGIFAAADILAAPNSSHPSAYYAERIKFFQYMAAGKAILAEKTLGALSVFGNTAYYVDLDDVEAMADAIVELHEDRDLRERLGRMARKRLEELFEWSILKNKLGEFISRIY